MGLTLSFVVLIVAAVASFLFATLAYSLRDFSRAALAAWLDKRGKIGRLEALMASEDELLLTSAIARAVANLVAILALVHVLRLLFPAWDGGWIYALTFVVGFVVLGLVAVVLPLALAKHAAEPFIGMFSWLLRAKRLVLFPLVRLHAPVDSLVRRVTGHGPADDPEEVEEELEQEILEIVAEGRQEGVIDEAERERIERVLRFQDATAAHAMTARPEIVGLPVDAPADEVLRVIDESGYSRIPVYAGSLDKVIGVLYARDLFRYVGKRLNGNGGPHDAAHEFRVAKVMRQPLFVPRTKPLADLLRDFQLQKVHMAIVLDEYGGTAGLVTIEDVLEELVGEIADEHEYDEMPMFRRIDERTAEVDARADIEELNRMMGVNLPVGAGFETLGGFVTTTLGLIPPAGTSFEYDTATDSASSRRVIVTVLDAEPQRVNRARLEVVDLQPARAEQDQEAAPAGQPS
jgi:CBS domain containing-hemolysin-like protein